MDQGNSFMDELSPFMALQKYRYKSIKFIDVFPEAKSLARKIHILYVDERPAWLGVKFSSRKNGYCSDGLRFLTSERHFMYLKAQVFQDKK